MKLLYDNMDDARNKLVGTFCMYNQKAVAVKHVWYPDDDMIKDNPNNEFIIGGNNLYNGRSFKCLLGDKDFDFSNLNIGYACREDGQAAAWYYRRPMRQYRQGLKNDQVNMKYSQRRYAEISFAHSKAIALMLENKYKSFEEIEEEIRSKTALIGAFHKNFAATYDEIHDDLIVEYKGKPIGHSISRNNFRLIDEAKHLTEHLMEAVG